MCQTKCPAKTVLTILGIVFWAAAAGLIFVGVYVYSSHAHLEEITKDTYTLIPAAIVIAVGVFLFILGIIGCVGAFKEQKCLLGLFFTFLLIIFVGLVAAPILAYVYRKDVDTAVHNGINTCMMKYNDSHGCKSEVDFMQKSFKCCGNDNVTDWKNTTWYKSHQATNKTITYPESCCKGGKCNYGINDTALFNEGCHTKLKDTFTHNLGIVLGVGGVFGLTLVVGMIFACVLICVRKRSEVPYMGLNDPDGMRV